VTVIRPVKGLDVDLDLNVRSGLDHGYPGEVETLFIFDDEREPGVPVVEKAIAEHRDSGRAGRAEILFCGQPPAGRTGKLNAMIQGVRRAQGQLVAFCDSDVRTDRDALRVLVETLLADPRNGSAFAPVVVSEPARTQGDATCAMLLNGLYTPSACKLLRAQGGELPFILGQFMVFRKESLAAIGGLENAGGQIVDDLYIGQLVRNAGLRNVASPHPIRIIQYGLGPLDAVKQFARWITFSRAGIPQWSFKLPIIFRAVTFILALAALVWCALRGDPIGALASAALAGGVVASTNALHNSTGCAPLRPRHWATPAVIFLLAPFVFGKIYLMQNRMAWRGRVYDLKGGRLAAQPMHRERSAAR
jgi:ceramide glucosyltransferase